jgi:dipeptidyl aminopeptidase/acylaminoacyl peptidase
MRRSVAMLLALVCAVPALAQGNHAFTFDDMMKLKRVEEPEVSPDGKWVLFAAVDVSLAANTRVPHVWAVPTAGGPEKQIITRQDADRPRWSPDGKHFAFLSTKQGGSQIWIADFDPAAGTATAVHKLTSIATEADGELWSPDGKNILFVSNVYPECDGPAAKEQACNARTLAEREKSPVKALIFTHLLYRHWNAYKEGKRSHLFAVSTDDCMGTTGCSAPAARDLTPGDYDAPVFSLGGQDDYAFSPDGQQLCYASNHDPVPAISTNNDLFTVPVNLGPDATPAQVTAQTKDITAANKASDTTPVYSPDGKYIAYRAQVRPGYESDRFRLTLYDRRSGYVRTLTKDLDRWVGAVAWSPDSTKIYFTAEDMGESPIHVVNAVSQMVESDEGTEVHLSRVKGVAQTVVGGTDDDLAPTPDGKFLLFSRMSVNYPPQIVRFSLAQAGQAPTVFQSEELCNDASGKMKPCKNPAAEAELQLTHLNDRVLSEVSMSPLEPFWFLGAGNDKVEGFMVKPPNFNRNRRYPVKFLIHGGPQGAWGEDWSYRWNPELFAANGYVVVMINFHGSTGYGQKFIDAINGDWGGAPYDDLMKGLDFVESHYDFIDKDRECALGASFGGYMANWILGHTNRFKCIVTHDGMFDTESAWGTTEELWFPEWEFKGTPYTNREMYRKWSPALFATNFKTPTLVIHGQKDYRLDVSQGFALFTTLQRLGVPSKMLYFPDEGHFVLKPQNAQLWYKTLNDWVDQWTKAGAK